MCHSQIVVRSGRYVIRQHLFAPKWRPAEECEGYTLWQNTASVESEYAVSESWAVYPSADDTEFPCASVQAARGRARFLAKCVRERKFPKAAKPKAAAPKVEKPAEPKAEKPKAPKAEEPKAAAEAAQCAAMKSDGTQCANKAKEGSKYCGVHAKKLEG